MSFNEFLCTHHRTIILIIREPKKSAQRMIFSDRLPI